MMNSWARNFSFFDTPTNNVKKREKPLDEDVASHSIASVKRHKKASSHSSVKSGSSNSVSSRSLGKQKPVGSTVIRNNNNVAHNQKFEGVQLDEESTQVRNGVCCF